MNPRLERRSEIVCIAGPNGAGKTTFYLAHVAPAGLRLVNADILALELDLEPYAAAALADSLRQELLRQGESFAFETVFSDPAGAKLDFLKRAVERGYEVVLCFIGVSTARICEERVSMRISQGGHDVPSEKLRARFPRTLRNLKTALYALPSVWVFDNTDLRFPFRLIGLFENGKAIKVHHPIPKWLRPLLPGALTNRSTHSSERT